jgi:hypothetical protein
LLKLLLKGPGKAEMMRFCLSVLLIFLLSACAVQKTDRLIQADFPAENCTSPFPKGKWRLIHSIEADLPGNQKSLMMGITVVDSQAQTLRCVMMTLEGLVLFDGRYENQQVFVERAIAPFNGKGFAEGMMEDVRFLFFQPSGQLSERGLSKNGRQVCRYRISGDERMEIVLDPEGRGWTICRHKEGKAIRTLIAEASKDNKLPMFIADRMELKAQGSSEYILYLKLVDVEAVVE